MYQQQIIGLVVGIIALFLVLAITKKIMKAILALVVILFTCVYLGIVSPKDAQDISQKLLNSAKVGVETIAENSKNVKISKGSIKVCIKDTWYDISEIAESIQIKDGEYSIKVNGKKIKVTDKDVQKVLSLIKEDK